MKRVPRLLGMVLWVASAGVLTGGCPLYPIPLEPPPEPAPGMYWVAEADGQLYGSQLPQQRDQERARFALAGESEWYAGPGFYRLDEDYSWSVDEELKGLTFDDLIQLLDPPPAFE